MDFNNLKKVMNFNNKYAKFIMAFCWFGIIGFILVHFMAVFISTMVAGCIGNTFAWSGVIKTLLSPIIFLLLYNVVFWKFLKIKFVYCLFGFWMLYSVINSIVLYRTISSINATQEIYFDVTNGHPLKRYYYDIATSKIYLFDFHISHHPTYGMKLKPITEKIIHIYKAQTKNDSIKKGVR